MQCVSVTILPKLKCATYESTQSLNMSHSGSLRLQICPYIPLCGDMVSSFNMMMVPSTRAVYVHSDVCGAVGGAVCLLNAQIELIKL